VNFLLISHPHLPEYFRSLWNRFRVHSRNYHVNSGISKPCRAIEDELRKICLLVCCGLSNLRERPNSRAPRREVKSIAHFALGWISGPRNLLITDSPEWLVIVVDKTDRSK
jgi:hypothetical protein